MSSSGDVALFTKKERVYCLHEETLFEAIVLDSELSDPTDEKSAPRYLVHYKGWKKVWDEWVLQDRLCKFNDENRELAKHLKKENLLQQRAALEAATVPPKKKVASSDRSSTRGSDEKNSSVPAAGKGKKRERRALEAATVSSKKKVASSDRSPTRDSDEKTSSVPAAGKKRERDSDVEKVGDVASSFRPSSVSSNDSLLGPSPKSSPGLPGFPKVVKRNNSRVNRSPLTYSWGLSEPPAKRLRTSEDGEPAHERLSMKEKLSILMSTAAKEIPSSLIRGSSPAPLHLPSAPPKPRSPAARSLAAPNKRSRSLSHKLPPPPATLTSLSEDNQGSSSAPSSAPTSPQPAFKESEETNLGRGHNNGKRKRKATHEIFGDAVIGAKKRSKNDPTGIHGKESDYPCGKLDNVFHDSLEYPRLEDNPFAVRHKAIRDDPRACAAKRHFFDGQPDHPAVLMIAGIPLEEKGAMGPTPSESQPSTLKLPGRKPAASKKKPAPKNKGKGKVDNSAMQEEGFHSRPSVSSKLSDYLKSILVDDWENVTNKLSLVPLPSAHPVNEILTEYFEEAKGKRELGFAEADLLEEIVEGLKEYFEKCLGRMLLYRFEREQLYELQQLWTQAGEEWEAGDVYGAEHLCRLLVSLPDLIAETDMDQQSVDQLLGEVGKLTKWLSKNSASFFTTVYNTATAEYIERARGN